MAVSVGASGAVGRYDTVGADQHVSSIVTEASCGSVRLRPVSAMLTCGVSTKWSFGMARAPDAPRRRPDRCRPSFPFEVVDPWRRSRGRRQGTRRPTVSKVNLVTRSTPHRSAAPMSHRRRPSSSCWPASPTLSTGRRRHRRAGIRTCLRARHACVIGAHGQYCRSYRGCSGLNVGCVVAASKALLTPAAVRLQ